MPKKRYLKVGRSFMVDRMLADALATAKGSVAQAALENRGALETAIAALTRSEYDDTCADLGEIVDALDEWHRAVMALTTQPVTIPRGFDRLLMGDSQGNLERGH